MLLSFASRAALLDTLAFGDAASEQAHGLVAERSDCVTGAVQMVARRLLPPETNHWAGGRVSFAMKVAPDATNYVTLRLHGADFSNNKLILFCEGMQVGYRHLGDYDLLDHGIDELACNGNFYFVTTPLPFDMTKGKTNLACEIRSTGRIWGYGSKFEEYQKPMTEPSRPIYRLYSHADGFFVPPADEPLGTPRVATVRATPGPEMLAEVRERVDGPLRGIVRDKRPTGQITMQFIANAWHVKWTSAYHNSNVVLKVMQSIDHLFARWRKDPKLVEGDPEVYNEGWLSFGLAADAVRLLAPQLEPYLDEKISDGRRGQITRRAAWSVMFLASRDYLRKNRRWYTNQSMIIDMNMYRSNRGLAAINPSKAMPETEALRYLYEACGIQPWLGSDTTNGPARPFGDDYFLLTRKGLTRELGFVGYYGEVLDWMTLIYDSTREPGQPGDAKILAQLVKVANARAVFRYPCLDANGHRAMRAETIVGWRDTHFPGNVTYAERPTWDASSIYAPAASLDPRSVGAAQQMFEDNQFFASLERQLTKPQFRTIVGMLSLPDDYDRLRAQPPSSTHLPMTPGQPDFVFADEEDGIVAIKNGDEILYASLYWRARHGVNFLARVHHITPRFDRIATVREDIEYTPNGTDFYTRPDWINFGFGNGGPRYPVKMTSVHAGEKLPIAKIPAGEKFRPGDEHAAAGKGDFYTLRYGPYLIAMNMSPDKTFELKPPPGVTTALNLATRKPVSLVTPQPIAPHTTLALFIEAK